MDLIIVKFHKWECLDLLLIVSAVTFYIALFILMEDLVFMLIVNKIKLGNILFCQTTILVCSDYNVDVKTEWSKKQDYYNG